MDKQHSRLDVIRILHAIDGDGDLCHAISSPDEQDVFLLQTWDYQPPLHQYQGGSRF
jgi:hypothetical protein